MIPAQARKALSLESGSPVVLTLVDGELRVRSIASAMAELQVQTASFLTGNGASVDAFLTARRAEAARDAKTSADTFDQTNIFTTESERGA